MTDMNKNLRALPGVDHLLELAKQDVRFSDLPRSVILDSLRQVLDHMRKDILAGTDPVLTDDLLLEKALFLAEEKIKPRLVSVINATGVVLHTNLGRALLCDDALSHITAVAKTYSNLELNLGTGKRGIRYEAVDGLLCELTGAESAIVVNNNAGAVLLALNTLARGREVVVSRGELVEIGGSFRVPDVMEKSGCILKEVGTTNRTHLRDYETAAGENTALFLKVHTSNYKIEGFTTSVALKDLVMLGQKKGVPVMEDLGSGTLIDFSKYGLPHEPTVVDAVRSGAHVVTFSGDKLLGGPQAGIIVGKKENIDEIRKNPLTRALRIDKLTLAALESTLKLYRDEEKALREIPTLRMLTLPFDDILKKACLLFQAIQKAIGPLADIRFSDMNSRPGGGSFPELDLPTRCVTIQPVNLTVSKLETAMRLSTPAIIGRIEGNRYILDPRAIQEGQETIIASTLARILKEK